MTEKYILNNSNSARLAEKKTALWFPCFCDNLIFPGNLPSLFKFLLENCVCFHNYLTKTSSINKSDSMKKEDL